MDKKKDFKPPWLYEKIPYLTLKDDLVPYLTLKKKSFPNNTDFIFGAQFETLFTSVSACC